jgi:DNA topoisomerase-1
MAEAKLELTTYHFSPEVDPKQDWNAKGSVITFEGFLRLYPLQSEEETILPALVEGVRCPSKELTGRQHFSKPPARYTEASLVKALEAKGIGRPSTYAPTIATIQDRGYVIKDQKKLKPTDIAFLVNDFLQKHFVDMMDYDFTAHMEKKLDEVAEG